MFNPTSSESMLSSAAPVSPSGSVSSIPVTLSSSSFVTTSPIITVTWTSPGASTTSTAISHQSVLSLPSHSPSPPPLNSSKFSASFSSTSSSSHNPLEASAAVLQTSDDVTTFLPTNTFSSFPTFTSPVSDCVTNCLQNTIVSLSCVTITSVECYCKDPQFVLSAFNCVESQCPANLAQAEDIAQEFCALVSTSLAFPSATVTASESSITNTTTSTNAASISRDVTTSLTKLIMSSLVFVLIFYTLQNQAYY